VSRLVFYKPLLRVPSLVRFFFPTFGFLLIIAKPTGDGWRCSLASVLRGTGKTGHPVESEGLFRCSRSINHPCPLVFQQIIVVVLLLISSKINQDRLDPPAGSHYPRASRSFIPDAPRDRHGGDDLGMTSPPGGGGGGEWKQSKQKERARSGEERNGRGSKNKHTHPREGAGFLPREVRDSSCLGFQRLSRIVPTPPPHSPPQGPRRVKYKRPTKGVWKSSKKGGSIVLIVLRAARSLWSLLGPSFWLQADGSR